MPKPPIDEVKLELYRAFHSLGADEILLGTLKSWCQGAPDADVLADLRNWNEVKNLEVKEWAA